MYNGSDEKRGGRARFAMITTDIAAKLRSSGNLLAVMVALAQHANRETGRTFVRVPTIAELLGMQETHVRAAIRRLVSLELLDHCDDELIVRNIPRPNEQTNEGRPPDRIRLEPTSNNRPINKPLLTEPGPAQADGRIQVRSKNRHRNHRSTPYENTSGHGENAASSRRDASAHQPPIQELRNYLQKKTGVEQTMYARDKMVWCELLATHAADELKLVVDDCVANHRISATYPKITVHTIQMWSAHVFVKNDKEAAAEERRQFVHELLGGARDAEHAKHLVQLYCLRAADIMPGDVPESIFAALLAQDGFGADDGDSANSAEMP